MDTLQREGISVDLSSFQEREVGPPIKSSVLVGSRVVQEDVQTYEYGFDIVGSMPDQRSLNALRHNLSEFEVHSVTVK